MKLSIITINYNNLGGLVSTYDSVVSQSCKDFEWIIIDGGSTDGSKEFIERHQDKFTYWCSEQDKGVYDAMNKGIAKTHGEYLNFMNSGDCFYDNYTIENVFSHEMSADLIYGDWIKVYPDHEEKRQVPKDNFNLTVFFENECHQAMFIKSELLKVRGYDVNFPIWADWKRWIEFSLEGRKFQYVPLTICRFAAGGFGDKDMDWISKEIDSIANIMPTEIGRHISEYYKTVYRLMKYENNSLIAETTRIALNGKSYKTKLLHINLILIKVLEKIFG